MKVLALDLATQTGWALTHAPDPFYGSERLVSGPATANIAHAQSRLWDWLEEMCAATNPQALSWEAPITIGNRAQNTEEFLFALANTAALFAYRKQLRPLKANVNTVRAKVCGNGHCGKDGALAYCIQRGWRPVDDNAADALVLLVYAQAYFDRTPIPAPQREMAV